MTMKQSPPSMPKRMTGQSVSHARSRVQERELAKKYKGKVTKQSGAGLVKGDVRIKGVSRIEAKTTIHKSFSVTTEHLRALEVAVIGTEEMPVMSIELDSGKVKFVVIPEIYFNDILTLLENQKRD